jgi:16S rRNA (guanine(966)-N(2))-methyltransferase RsmD
MSKPRIIGGTARGIRLDDVSGDITRPIADFVKEALFNILGTDVIGSTWLDVFAGTGSVGIEAISRGAQSVQLNDLNRAAIQTLNDNLKKTHLEGKGTVTQGDAFALLARPSKKSFDFIYIAPPQYKGMWEKAMDILDGNPSLVFSNGCIIVQIDPIEYKAKTLLHFIEVEQRKYGNTLLLFYEPSITTN